MPASKRPTAKKASQPAKAAPVTKQAAKAPSKSKTTAKTPAKVPARSSTPSRPVQKTPAPVAERARPLAQPKAATAVGSPLTATQQAAIERELLAERARAMRSSASYEDMMSEDTRGQGSAGDVVDQSSDLSTRENATLLATRSSGLVREIDEALTRLRREGANYNTCMVCGARIPFGRLELLPTTQHCAAHATGRR